MRAASVKNFYTAIFGKVCGGGASGALGTLGG